MDEELNGVPGAEGNEGEGTGATAPAPEGTENPSAGDGAAPALAREGETDWRAALPEGWADRLRDVKDADEAMKALERGLSYRPA